MKTDKLNRKINTTLLTLYGLGTILGAGIYVLIGEVAGQSGVFSPFAFVVAGVLATFTALAYAELSSRFPVSAGEAVYLQEGFGLAWLSSLMGWLVVVIGITSSATIANGFVGYFQRYVPVPSSVVLIGLIIVLGVIASYGILQSVWVATLVTIAEVFGLLLVIGIALPSWQSVLAVQQQWVSQFEFSSFPIILAGAFLAFYAFIGFEDMVNVAEEVIDPVKALPRAIIIALVVSSLLYFIVAFIALTAMPVDQLAQSQAPLADIVASQQPRWAGMMTLISLVAVVNGALVQIIMVSRVLYGMGDRGLAPQWLASVHPVRKTPLIATLLTSGVVLVLAVGFDLVTLAKMTSGMTLFIFALVNLALVKIKWQGGSFSGFTIPLWLPMLGFILNFAVLIYQLLT